MKPIEIISEFDEYLEAQGLRFDGIAIGGAALAILGVITRETQDCDILDPDIPPVIAKAAVDFCQEIAAKTHKLKEDWFNNGPASLKDALPSGWRFRLEKLYSGKALSLQTLGRADFLKSKLFAYCDRGQDLKDCVAMKPASDEILAALEWVKAQDAHPGWPDHVDSQMLKLAARLNHGT